MSPRYTRVGLPNVVGESGRITGRRADPGTRRLVVLLALSLCALDLCGCANSPPPRSTAGHVPDILGPTGSGRAAGKNPYADVIAMDALRERSISLLAAGASGKSAEERANAIEALSAVPTRLEPLVRAALTDENLAVRTVAAMTIGRARLAASAPFVEPLLRDQSPMVRAAAIYALYRCAKPVDMTPLGDMLQDPSPRVRAHAAFVLGEAGEPSAIGPLRDAGKDPMPRAGVAEVRLMQLQMAEARIKLGDDDGLHEVRAALFPARSEDLEATALSAQIVGQVRDKASVDQLITLTAMKDDSGRHMPAEVRLSAAASLARLGLPRGSFIAREYVASDLATQRAQAAYVFGETGQMDNLVPLSALLEDKDGLVRIAAAAAVLKITENAASGSARAAE